MSIKLEHINYVYSEGTAYEKHALKDVSLEIPHGEFVGIIGHTGSGKSTLIQHLNGLIKATSGALYYNGENIYGENYNLRELRNQVGLVFQYPEHQLFEVNVLQDVCFGPKNQGLSPEECEKRAREALQLVGLKEKYFDHSPFDLSGGQKRRAAIAGVLAMRPKVLVLDEPTAGLDPKERVKFRNIISSLGKEKTVLLSTHIVSDIEYIADQILIMKDGELICSGTEQGITASVKGYVWKCNVSTDVAQKLCNQYMVSNLRNGSEENQAELRIISEKCPFPAAELAEETLEDAYLYHTQITGEEKNATL